MADRVFAVPRDGTYLFIWNSMTAIGHYCKLYLIKNGLDLGFVAYSDGLHGYAGSGSMSVLLELGHKHKHTIKRRKLNLEKIQTYDTPLPKYKVSGTYKPQTCSKLAAHSCRALYWHTMCAASMQRTVVAHYSGTQCAAHSCRTLFLCATILRRTVAVHCAVLPPSP